MGNDLQISSRNDLRPFEGVGDALEAWVDAYFQFEVTTLASSQAVQRRDLNLLIQFMGEEIGEASRLQWTPRVSASFIAWLKKQLEASGKRRFSDRTINRITAHVKTFAKWVHRLAPFTLGQPMAKVRAIPTASRLDVDRAISEQERRRILDAADMLLTTGATSKDRNRYKGKERPQRKDYRPYRNRAIIYTLIETGMRRAAITRIDLDGVDVKRSQVRVIEKGDVVQVYDISREGMRAITDYLEHGRPRDAENIDSAALFLPFGGRKHSSGYLSVRSVWKIWNHVTEAAGVEGKTPHSARHAMGRHVMEKSGGNAAAVARQLKHKNVAYSLQYSRVTTDEMHTMLNDRE